MSDSKFLMLVGAGSVLVACNGGGGGGGGGTPGPDGGMGGDGAMMSDTGTSSGGDSSSTMDSAAGDTGSSADSGGDGAGGDGGMTSCPGSTVDAGSLMYTGVVELSRVGLPTPVKYAALAQLEPTAGYPPSNCTGIQMGACCYESTPADAGLPTLESAGDITITDGTGATLATLMPPSYVASSTTDSTLTWTPGTMLTVTAAGATVGPFTATVAAPPYLSGITPAFNTALAIKTSADFVVSWTPSKRPCDKISVGLSQGSLMPYIGCVVDDSAGTVTIPATMLGMFTSTSGSAVIERVSGTHVQGSNADIGLAVINVQTTTTTYMP